MAEIGPRPNCFYRIFRFRTRLRKHSLRLRLWIAHRQVQIRERNREMRNAILDGYRAFRPNGRWLGRPDELRLSGVGATYE